MTGAALDLLLVLQAQLVKALDDRNTCLPWWQAEQQTQHDLLRADWQGWPQGQSLRPSAELLLQQGRVRIEEAHLLGPPHLLEQQQRRLQHQQHEEHLHDQHPQHHRRHHKEEQQGLFEFKLVKDGWSDDALIYLQELYKAEDDTVDFYLAVSKLCCEELKEFQRELQEQLEEQLEDLQIQQQQQQQQQQQDVSSEELQGLQQELAAQLADLKAQQQQQQQQRRGQAASSSGHRHSRKASHSTAAATASASSTLQLPTAQLAASKAHNRVFDNLQQELSQQLGKPVVFNEGQRAALLLAQRLPVMALTGGPGCGKTLVSQAIAQQWSEDMDGTEIFMAAPTGGAVWQWDYRQMVGCICTLVCTVWDRVGWGCGCWYSLLQKQSAAASNIALEGDAMVFANH